MENIYATWSFSHDSKFFSSPHDKKKKKKE